MKTLDENEIILQKALASKIEESLFPVKSKMDKACSKIISKIESLEKQIEKSSDIKKIAILSKQVSELQDNLIKALSLSNRVNLLISRNSQRIEHFKNVLKNAGIYNEQYSKDILEKMQEYEKDNVSTSSLNLNLYAEKGKISRFVFGKLLVFSDGKLDLSQSDNAKVLTSFSSEEIKSLISLYPESVSTIPDEAFMDVHFKQRLLKEIVSYVDLESKTKSIKQVNEKLGNLLSFKTQITKNVADYVAGVQNMFDAIAKSNLIKKFPEKSREIKRKLKCNSRSELIPSGKREAILANGMAGEVNKAEEEESEELRMTQERELQQQIWTDNILDALLEEQEEKANEEIAKQQEELEKLKKFEEDLKKKKEEEQEQEQVGMSKTYTKYDD